MNDDNDPNQQLAIWRFSIIAPLLHRDADGETMDGLLARLESQTYATPSGRPITLSRDTIRKWLYRYRQGGLLALENQQRSDHGSTSVSRRLADGLFAIRKSHPRWTLAKLLEQASQQGLWDGRKPSRSALYRFARRHNLHRGPSRRVETTRAFAFQDFGQLWMADFLHGPKLRDGRERRKTYLHVILDDSSRYVIHGGFSYSENVRTLLSDLMRAVRRFGIPQRFYTDNGPCYSSRHLKLVCARLGTQLVHTPPYRPQGRGKVERLFRTVRDQFLSEGAFTSLDALNQGFQSWLSDYHGRLHSGLGLTPLAARLRSRNCCRPLPEIVDIDALFRMERRCRVYSDGTVRLFKRVFEVPGCPPQSRITVFFMPWEMDRLYYGDDMNPARLLDRHANARRFQRP